MPQTRPALTLPDGRQTTYTINMHHERETAGALRKAFSFLRANGDRRYSATVLMTLMDHADRMDAWDEEALEEQGDQNPTVITIETPYHYDEETETKTGGLAGVLVALPDGRCLLATHRNNRRQGIGRFMLDVLNSYIACGTGHTFWIHQENREGQMFALSIGLIPYEVNRRGAVMYRNEPPHEGDDGAVAFMEDNEIEQRLRRGRRPSSFRARAVADSESCGYAECDCRNSHYENIYNERHPAIPDFSVTTQARPPWSDANDWTRQNTVILNPAAFAEVDPQLERLLAEEERIEAAFRSRHEEAPESIF